MRKLVESTLVSLDGVVGSPGAWARPYWDDEADRRALAQLADFDTFLFGRKAYEEFAPRWSQIEGDPYMDKVNALPKLVASTTLREVTWNASLLQGDVATELAKLKRQPGKNIIKYGTGDLDRTLFRHKLIDELHLWIFPLVVGSGKHLFDGIDPTDVTLKLARTTTSGNGIVIATYVPA